MIKYPDKSKVLEELKDKYVGNDWIDNFFCIDEFYRENQKEIDENLLEELRKSCKKCSDMQGNGKGKINYIYFSFLRTSIIQGKGEFRIDFYDEKWFLDNEECSLNIDLSFLYIKLFELKETLKDKKIFYGRVINDIDIEEIILDEADKYHILACEFLKDIITDKFLLLDEYKKIKKDNKIKIFIGEFMDYSEMIYEGSKESQEV